MRYSVRKALPGLAARAVVALVTIVVVWERNAATVVTCMRLLICKLKTLRVPCTVVPHWNQRELTFINQ
eukprot:1850384-Amphidinium_carterae.1